MVDIPHPPRASDVYNQPTRGGRDGQGYGLDDGPSGSSIITVMDDVGNSPALGGSWGLTPYAGVERRPLPPSPVKMQVSQPLVYACYLGAPTLPLNGGSCYNPIQPCNNSW